MFPKIFLAASGVFLLAACNLDETGANEVPADPDKDRYHERSFSWDDAPDNEALAKVAARETRFETAEAFTAAVTALDSQLTSPGVSDSLWKPIDYACDELALALWNRYGTITLGDSVILDESSLKAGCRYIGEDADKAGLAKASDDNTGAVVDDRQFPYKMIGESWSEFNIGVYKSTGGETQFKKRRERFGVMGWYDTDANRIGVRIYLFNCSSSRPKVCYNDGSTSDWYKNDDYVSKRRAGFGIKIKMTRPTPENNYTPSPKGLALMDFNVADAVVTMHSADHAGLQFRAISSSGLNLSADVPGPQTYGYDYVTW